MRGNFKKPSSLKVENELRAKKKAQEEHEALMATMPANVRAELQAYNKSIKK